MSFRAQRTVSPVDGLVGWVVVNDGYECHAEASAYLRWLRFGNGRSSGTARLYAGRLALYLTWADERCVDWRSPSLEQLTSFMRWAQFTPSPNRATRNRLPARVAVLNGVLVRQPGTVNGVLTAVAGFLKYCALHGQVDAAVVARLSQPQYLHSLPPGADGGESGGRVKRERMLTVRSDKKNPETLSPSEIDAMVAACRNVRDRFLVQLLAGTGLRVGEACGLRRSDMHLLPSSAHLGCRVDHAHVHVIRREGNENGALAKSPFSRVVPVSRALARCYVDYRLARDEVPEAAASDFVLVNLFRPPLGRAMSLGGAEELFERLSVSVGLRVRPHMLRHSYASALIQIATPDVVRDLLGHGNIKSTDVYLHPSWETMCAAVDQMFVPLATVSTGEAS